jgi:hypothetical protein
LLCLYCIFASSLSRHVLCFDWGVLIKIGYSKKKSSYLLTLLFVKSWRTLWDRCSIFTLFHQLCLICFFEGTTTNFEHTQRTYLEAKQLRTSHI